MKKIFLTQNKFALVDDEDYEYLNQWKWCLSHGYAVRSSVHGITQMHRLIHKAPPGFVTDHINRNKLDNRRNNLRTATYQLNCMNSSSIARSGFRGVRKVHKGSGWDVRVLYKNKQIYIGSFQNIIHAAVVYDLWIKDIYGDTLPTNF